MTQMMALDKDIKTVITIFHMFWKVEERLRLLNTDIKDVTQLKSRDM